MFVIDSGLVLVVDCVLIVCLLICGLGELDLACLLWFVSGLVFWVAWFVGLSCF